MLLPEACSHADFPLFIMRPFRSRVDQLAATRASEARSWQATPSHRLLMLQRSTRCEATRPAPQSVRTRAQQWRIQSAAHKNAAPATLCRRIRRTFRNESCRWSAACYSYLRALPTVLLLLLGSGAHLPIRGQSLNSGQLPAATRVTGDGLPTIVAPTRPRTIYTRFPWKLDITATIFWVGEKPSQNNPTPNDKSSWDVAWEKNFGGYDDPDISQRTRDYCPAAFVPQENPFYIALPYNDIAAYNKHKPEASRVIPWFRKRYTGPGRTVLKGQWVAIRYAGRTCFAQWEDCGPFVTDDYNYVFGRARPKNSKNKAAGIDISPACRDYLRLRSGAAVDWRFVDLEEVPDGPWCRYGRSNPMRNRSRQPDISEQQRRLQELKRMRDQWFQQQYRPPTSVDR